MKESTRLKKLLSEPLESEGQFVSLKKSEETISMLFNTLIKYTAKIVFLIGRELTLIKNNLEHGKFLKWLDENKKFPYARRTAYNYMSFYERFSCANFAQLEGLTVTEALRAAEAKERPQVEDAAGLNRIDLGGDPGQMQLDYGDLFKRPANANRILKNYRTVADLLTEIIVVHRTKNGLLTSKRIAHFCEDMPRDPALSLSYKKMVYKTQAAIEEYLADVEREEE